MTRRLFSLALAVVFALVVASCGDDDDGDASGDTTAPTDAADSTDETDPPDSTDTEDPDEGSAGTGAVGSVTVDGEERSLDTIAGVLSCDFDNPDEEFRVAARSETRPEDGGTFLTLTTFGTSAGNNEFGLTAGDIEYFSESADSISFKIDDRTVSGTVGVVPLFEEGTAQDVSFSVTCP